METPKALLIEVREHVAHITLNRPEGSNAMNLEMAREFYEAAFECEQSSDVRAVLITGAGRAFCSGGGVASFLTPKAPPPPARFRPTPPVLHLAFLFLAPIVRDPVLVAQRA